MLHRKCEVAGALPVKLIKTRSIPPLFLAFSQQMNTHTHTVIYWCMGCRRVQTTVAHLNKQWQKWLRMSTHAQTHNTNNKRTHGPEQQTVATVSNKRKKGTERKKEGSKGVRRKWGGIMGWGEVNSWWPSLWKNRAISNWWERLNPPSTFFLHRSNQTFPSHSKSPAAPCERRIKPRHSSCLKSAHTIVAIMKTDYHTASDISDKEELGSPVLPLMSGSSLFALIPLNSKFHYPAPSTIWLSWARLILTRLLMYGKCICWGGYTSVPILLFPVPSLKSIVWPVSFRLKSTVRTKGELFENQIIQWAIHILSQAVLKSPSEAGDEHNRKVCAALLSLWRSDFKTFTCFCFACHPAVAFWDPAGHQQARQLYCGTVGAWYMDDLTESLTCSDDLIVIHVFYVMIDGHLIKVTTSFDHPTTLVCTRSKSAAKNRARRHVRKGWKHQRESATRGTKKAKKLSLSHFSIKQNIENKSNSPAHSSLFSIPFISVKARLMYLFFILYIAHPHESVSSFVLHLPMKVNNECTKKPPQVFIFAIIALHLAEIYNAKNPRS